MALKRTVRVIMFPDSVETAPIRHTHFIHHRKLCRQHGYKTIPLATAKGTAYLKSNNFARGVY
jgi:hypothetical protein